MSNVNGIAPVLLAGSASAKLAARVSEHLGIAFSRCSTERFPDGEVAVRLDAEVRGLPVVLLQATGPAVNDHLVELLALADACRREAADRVVAVIPYFGYARSDRRDEGRTPIMARLAADLLECAGVDHVVTVDVHTPALEGFFHVPSENLTAVPLLAAALKPRFAAGHVIVAPDLGAVRLANRYAGLLDAEVAICHKHRISGTEVNVHRITGEVAGRRCTVVDDMIATGGTVVESIRALRAAGARPDVAVVATHGVFTPGALARLADAGVHDVTVTDSLEPAGGPAPIIPSIVSISPMIASAITAITALASR